MDTAVCHTRRMDDTLKVYRRYLRDYLYGITKRRDPRTLMIADVFAGAQQPASAVIARDAIANAIETAFERKMPGVNNNLRLVLNANNNADNLAQLQKQAGGAFADIYNADINKLIPQLTADKTNYVRRLFFVNPFAYADMTKENLRRIFSAVNSEVFVVIPQGGDKRDAVDAFIACCGIGADIANARNIGVFCHGIRQVFYSLSGADFIHSRVIGAPAEGCHCLFFITHYAVRARFFLESAVRISRKNPDLFDPDKIAREKALANYLDNWRDNADIYRWALMRGALPAEIHPILRQWEKEDRLKIQSHPERRKGAFYLTPTPAQPLRLKIR